MLWGLYLPRLLRSTWHSCRLPPRWDKFCFHLPLYHTFPSASMSVLLTMFYGLVSSNLSFQCCFFFRMLFPGSLLNAFSLHDLVCFFDSRYVVVVNPWWKSPGPVSVLNCTPNCPKPRRQTHPWVCPTDIKRTGCPKPKTLLIRKCVLPFASFPLRTGPLSLPALQVCA